MKLLSQVLTAGLVCGTATLLWGEDELSTRTRHSAFAYGSQTATCGAEVGAELLPRDLAAALFTPLEDSYRVLEVGVYPVRDQTVELKRSQFRLRVGGKTVKAQHPWAIADSLVQTASPEPGMQKGSYGGESVGVRMESGRPTEVFREQRAGVAVSNGRYGRLEDRDRMYRELDSLGLPEGRDRGTGYRVPIFRCQGRKSE